MEDYGLKAVYDPPDANIDIVAVHGLNPTNVENHAVKTWTAKGEKGKNGKEENGKMWLEDKEFLPESLPNARVLLFSYNANVGFATSTTGVREEAERLLAYLKDERRCIHDRPIIFVCHSLGGLVVKRALLTARLTDNQIKQATSAIVFFATPHDGGNGVALGQIAAKITRFTLGNPKNTMLDSLVKDGIFANELKEDFRYQLNDYRVVSFFETKNTGKFGLIVDKKSAMLGIARETQLALNGNHSEICKFADPKSGAYKIVQGRLVECAEEALREVEARSRLADLEKFQEDQLGKIRDGVSEMRRRQEEQEILARRAKLENEHLERRKQLFEWLSATDPSHNFEQANGKRLPETGHWFLRSAKYDHWKKTSASWLWLHGIPGCGKTILNSAIVLDLKDDAELNASVIYFYFKFSDEKTQTADQMVRSLIGQLSKKDAHLPQPLVALFSSCERPDAKPSSPTTESLLEVLREMLGNQTATFLVLDGLDESNDQDGLLDAIEKVASWEIKTVHVLMTSRREAWMECFDDFIAVTSTIAIQNIDVNRDIHLLVKEKLRNGRGFLRTLKRKRLDVSERIELELMQKADGMFLWAELQLAALADCWNIEGLEEALSSLPTTLNGTWDRILAKIDMNTKFNDTRRILEWLVFSARRLRVEEVCDIIAIALDGPPNLKPNRRLLGAEGIVTLCSSLVRITKDPKTGEEEVELAHFSVKEYLVSTQISESAARPYRLENISSHLSIAKLCLVHLLHFNLPPASLISSETEEKYPLARYSADYWTFHARFAGQDTSDVDELIQKLFLSSKAFHNWVRLATPDVPESGPQITIPPAQISTPIYYASLSGLISPVRQLLQYWKSAAYQSKMRGDWSGDINSEIGFAGTALQAACHNGFNDTVQLLLDLDADVNALADDGRTALQVASHSGHKSTVELLLSRGAKVNSKRERGYFGNALQAASYKGHNEIVRILLDAGADINAAVPSQYCTALIAASYSGFHETVKLLLERGADVKVRGGRYGDALQAAIYDGRDGIVEILLDAGADVNAVGGHYYNALIAAARQGNLRNFKLLLDKGANVNVQGGRFGSPLQAACHGGREEMVKLLLERDADIHACGGELGDVKKAAEYPTNRSRILRGLTNWENYGHWEV